MLPGADMIRNLKIRERVQFGEEERRWKDLMDLRVVEYFVTADNIVPCNLFVASRQTFAVVFSDKDGAVYVFNNDGRSHAYRFVRKAETVDKFRLFEFKPLESLRMQCEYFKNPEFNDTAVLFFGQMGNRCTESALVDQQAYERFRRFAMSMSGTAFTKGSVDLTLSPPTLLWKSSFDSSVCTVQHSLALWANGPITANAMPNNVVQFTDSEGHTISVIHCSSDEPTWQICSVQFHGDPLGPCELNLPVALTAPYQIAFPGCDLLRKASAESRRLATEMNTGE